MLLDVSLSLRLVAAAAARLGATVSELAASAPAASAQKS
jgi:hypothetical protein